MTDQPEEPEGTSHEKEDEPTSESQGTAHDQTGEDDADNGAGEKPQPVWLTPTVDLSGLINTQDFARHFLSEFSDISGFWPDLSGIMPDLPAVMPDLSAFTRNLPAIMAVSEFEGRFIAALDVSRLAPKIDYASFFPKIELPDLSAVLPPLLPEFGPAFSRFLESLRESLPPNWPGDIDLNMLTTAIQRDGLPLVWVPRAEIVTEVLAAPDRAARVDVLLAHVDEIVHDCRLVLSEISHGTLSGQLPLAVRALQAFEAGHYEAAQALAVTVTETAVARAIGGNYANVKQRVLFDPNLVPYTRMRLQAAFAPIGSFYTSWFASSGSPPPAALSRHVTVHQADQDHYTRGNGVVAVMLVTSVLRALQELQELAESSDEDEAGGV